MLLSNLTEASHYSWGAAVLASIFRALDRAVMPDQTEINGCLLLLQSWAWDHIKYITPKIDHLSWKKYKKDSDFLLHEGGLVQGSKQIFPPIQ